MTIYDKSQPLNNVVGNVMFADTAAGFKSEVKHVFENYSQQGLNLTSDLQSIMNSPQAKADFIDTLMESVVDSPVTKNPLCANTPFYNNYSDRVEQLMENSFRDIAVESVMFGYSPIVAYNPFFLKKQWIECVYKDVLMTEVPNSPVVNYGFEKLFLKTSAGERYPLPESLYDDDLMGILMGEATGNSIKEAPLALSLFASGLSLVNPSYIPGVILNDPNVELTPNLHVFKVVVEDAESTETPKDTYEVPVNIKVDVTTKNFINGKIKYDVKDDDGVVLRTITDEILGNLDPVNGKVILVGTTGAVKSVCLRGKIANRFNDRSLDTIRELKQETFTMPESGPRLNTSITIEEASDALALQNIDIIADNVDRMGRVLANFEDFEIKNFLKMSFDAQESAGVGPHGYEKLTVVGNFDALPYEEYNGRISDWMKDSREYFERVIAQLKRKLITEDAVIVAVGHPNTVRFLQDGINWVFAEDTHISGLKLSYKFGIYTSAQDRVHVITSMRMKEEEGINFVVIPLTQDLITFKHLKYNMVIDRGYRHPVRNLTPNILVTHRTLTFEILPVQGKMNITGRDLHSPTTLKRA